MGLLRAAQEAHRAAQEARRAGDASTQDDRQRMEVVRPSCTSERIPTLVLDYRTIANSRIERYTNAQGIWCSLSIMVFSGLHQVNPGDAYEFPCERKREIFYCTG